MQTKSEIKATIAKIEKSLENPKISSQTKAAMKKAVENARKLLESAPAESAPKTKETTKKHRDIESECEEILRKAKDKMKADSKRAEERRDKGLPPTLTPAETVVKAAKKVKKKVREEKNDGEHPTVKERKMTKEGVIEIIVAFASALDKSQARAFINELLKKLKSVVGTVKAARGMNIGGNTGHKSIVFNVMNDGKKEGEIRIIAEGKSNEQIKKDADQLFNDYYQKYYKSDDSHKRELVRDHAGYFEDGGNVSGSIPEYFGKGENIDVFGYQTEYFINCPEAAELFKKVEEGIQSNPLKGFKEDGLRECVVLLDALFGIEDRCVTTGNSEDDDCEKSINLALTSQALFTDANCPEILSFVWYHIKNIIRVYIDNEYQEPEYEEETEQTKESEPSDTETETTTVEIEEPSENEPPPMAKGGTTNTESYSEFEAEVVRQLEDMMDIDHSDAQGLVDSHSFDFQNGWNRGSTPKTTADNIKKSDEMKNKTSKAAKGKHIGFKALSKKIENEYLKKGYSKKRATKIGLGAAEHVKLEIASKRRKKK